MTTYLQIPNIKAHRLYPFVASITQNCELLPTFQTQTVTAPIECHRSQATMLPEFSDLNMLCSFILSGSTEFLHTGRKQNSSSLPQSVMPSQPPDRRSFLTPSAVGIPNVNLGQH